MLHTYLGSSLWLCEQQTISRTCAYQSSPDQLVGNYGFLGPRNDIRASTATALQLETSSLKRLTIFATSSGSRAVRPSMVSQLLRSRPQLSPDAPPQLHLLGSIG